MKKGILCLSVIFMLVLTMVMGCASTSTSQEGNKNTAPTENTDKTAGARKLKTIGVSCMDSSWQFFVYVNDGMKEVAEKNGIKLNIQDAKNDAATQMNQVDTFISQGVDAIIVDTIDKDSLTALCKKAEEKGIAFIGRWTEVDGATCNVVLDEYKYGYAIGQMGAEWANKNYPGQEIQAALMGMYDYKPSVVRLGGVKDAFIKFFPTGKIVAEEQANDVESAVKAMEGIYQAHPNVKIVLCDSDDTAAIGATEALKSLVKKEDYSKYYVGGSDAVDQARQLIKEDSPMKGTIDLQNAKIGRDSINLLIDWANGKTLPDKYFCEFVPLSYEDIMKAN